MASRFQANSRPDAASVDPLLDAILASEKVTKIFPAEIFRQKDYVRGFASVLCHEGFVHSDFVDSKFADVVQPAAVFYFAFDGTSTGPGDNLTGTAFYREVETGIERVKDVRDWSDDLPSSAFQRTHCNARPTVWLVLPRFAYNAFGPGTHCHARQAKAGLLYRSSF